MAQGEGVEDGLPRLLADVVAQHRVAEQGGEAGGELIDAARIDEPAVGAVADDFFDALAAASDGDFAGGHRFQIDAAQAFIAAGEREERAALQETGDFAARDAAEETHAVGYFQFGGRGRRGEIALRTVTDDLQRRASGCVALTAAMARRRMSWPLMGMRLPMVRIEGGC